MAMRLLIDGYNLLGCRPGFWKDWAGHRTRLIEELRRYAEHKQRAVTVVFDGWRTDREWEEVSTRDRVTVIYTKQGEPADDVIVRLCDVAGRDSVVVTSDRDVAVRVRTTGCTVVTAGEFSVRLHRALAGIAEAPQRGSSEKRGNPYRLSREARRKRRQLQRL